MSKLIAIVAVLTVIDGVRTLVNPGEEVTGLQPLDEAELKRIGAIQDADELAADEKTARSAEAKSAREFANARKLELAKQAATV